MPLPDDWPNGNPFQQAAASAASPAPAESPFQQGMQMTQAGPPTAERDIFDHIFGPGRFTKEIDARLRMDWEKNQRADASAKAATAEQARKREAWLTLAQRAGEIRQKMPDATPNAIFNTLLRDKEFTSAFSAFSAQEIPELVQATIQAVSPAAPGKPIQVTQGSALYDPTTKKELYKNVAPSEGDKAAQTEIAKRAVASFGKAIEDGQGATSDIFLLEKIAELNKKGMTGIAANLSGYLTRFGIPAGSDIEAYQALINRLTPSQRQGLPGAASDRDVAMFKGSLPSLLGSKEGNELIINTLTKLAEDKIQRGLIANDVYTGRKTVPQAIDAMEKLSDPMGDFRKAVEGQRSSAPVAGKPQLGADPARAGRGNVLRWNPETGRVEPKQ